MFALVAQAAGRDAKCGRGRLTLQQRSHSSDNRERRACTDPTPPIMADIENKI